MTRAAFPILAALTLLAGCYGSHEGPALALCPDEVEAFDEKAAELGCEPFDAGRLEECPTLCTTIDRAGVRLDDTVRDGVTTCEQLEAAADSLCPRR